MKPYKGLIKHISFSIDTNGQLVLTAQPPLASNFEDPSIQLTPIQSIMYFTDGFAEIETTNARYGVIGDDWIMIRFLYDSSSYRDKCIWNKIERVNN